LLGLVLALLFGNPYLSLTRKVTPRLLTLSVIGLGAGMDLRVVASAGASGLGYTLVGIAVCLLLGTLLRHLLAVERNTGLLIAVGTAICGGSAIAATAKVLRAREHEISVALGTVFLLNAVALFLFPAIGHALSLSPARFGLWAAIAIHDTSSVVGAALRYGGGAVLIATPVKLARALWIVPLTAAIAFVIRREERGPDAAPRPAPRRPWFILGFVLCAGCFTFVPVLSPVVSRGMAPGVIALGQGMFLLAKQTLVLTLFLIGANLTRAALWAVGPRALLLGVLLWLAMGGLGLVAILAGLVSG
jgi:uncharacterized membrane protein YadS